MNISKKLIYLLILACLSSCGNSSIVYADAQYLFENFDYKKNLEVKLNEIKMERQKILDSLEFGLNVLAKEIDQQKPANKTDIATFQVKKDVYLKKKQEFEADNSALTDNYDKQIITQLNQYIKEYGEKKGYEFILGSSNNSEVLYAKENKNISKALLQYVNEKFNGKTDSK